MGVVYEAEDLKLGRHVALKLIAGNHAGESATLERFWREARTASALNHPGICTIYEINESESQPFLVMELLDGQSLDRLYVGQAMPIPRLIELGVQLSDAVDAAHRKGILHRDLKPANIFVTGSGQAKILDFGLARFQEAGSTDSTDAGVTARDMLTSPGTTLGTIAYMSPEQARGEELDARSDVFSLGVVMYEMATGKHPFGGTTSAVVFDKLLNYVPAAAISLNHELPPEFENLLNKALEKDRELRYQSAAELRADLRRLQRSSSSSRVAASAAQARLSGSYAGMTRADSVSHTQAVVAQSGNGSRGETAPRAGQRNFFSLHLVWLTGAAMAVVLAAGAGLGIWHHHRKAAAAAAAAATAPPAAKPAPAPVTTAAAPIAKPSPSTPAEPSPSTPAEPSPEPRETASTHARRAKPKPAPAPPPVVQPVVAKVVPAPAAPPPPPAAQPAPRKPAAPAAVSYSARHMRLFGMSSKGTLKLTATELSYTSNAHSVSVSRNQIRAIDGNAVVETDGKKWRFEIDGMSNEQVHDLLARWYASGPH